MAKPIQIIEKTTLKYKSKILHAEFHKIIIIWLSESKLCFVRLCISD